MTKRKGKKYSVDAVKMAAVNNWRAVILAKTDVDPKFLDGRQQPCPKCGGSDRFRVFNDFDAVGGAYCNACFSVKNGDGFAFLQWYNGWTFEKTLEVVADYLNVKLEESSQQKTATKKAKPKPAKKEPEPEPEQSPFEKWEQETLTPMELREVVSKWAATRPGVDVEAVMASDPMVGYWPKSGKARQRVIGFRGWGKNETGKTEPVALHLYPADGKRFPAVGYLVERKNHNVGGSKNAWLIVGGMARFKAADIIWKVEGITDAFALLPLLPANHSIVTATNGAAWKTGSSRMPPLDIFRNRRVIVCGDADVPGQSGAEIFAADVKRYAREVFMCLLPYPIEPVHGRDCRDWVCEDEYTWPHLRGLIIERDYLISTRASVFGGLRVMPERKLTIDDMTDIANGHHLAVAAQYELRHVHAWKRWLFWDGKRWANDDVCQVQKVAKRVAAEVFDDANASTEFTKLRFAQKTSNASGLNAMVTMARDELAVRVDDLDRDSWLFNCANGTIDLRTGELFCHRQDDLQTKLSDVMYSPGMPCPRWLRFLDEVFEAVDGVVPFLQRWFGYCLTGDIREQQFPIFWGTGSNGKSTLMNVVQGIFGRDYAMQQKPDLLVAKRTEPHPSELATMFGKRLVVMSETEADQKLAEAKLKALTGGEPVPCRRMNEDWWEFLPEFKFILVTNKKPQVHSQDFAIWRRLLMIPFQQQFKGERKDPELADRLSEEMPGVLAWMVEGCLEWQRNGLQPPEAIVSATEEYARSEDIVGRFVADCCIMGAGLNVRAATLRTRYEQWAADNGGPKTLSQRKIADWLKEHGCEKTHSNGTVWHGVGVRYTGNMAEADGRSYGSQPDVDVAGDYSEFDSSFD